MDNFLKFQKIYENYEQKKPTYRKLLRISKK